MVSIESGAETGMCDVAVAVQLLPYIDGVVREVKLECLVED